MAQDPQGYGGAPPPAAPRKGGWGKWVAIGCIGLLLIGGLIAGVVWFVVMKATEGPEQTVRDFLAAAAAGDYQTAHGYFSAPLKEVQPYEAFEAMARENPTFFAVKDATFTNRSVDMNGAELSGNVELESGTEMPAQFKLVRENGEWRLIAYNIGS